MYAGVLRRYLTTSADNSFPEHTFKRIFLLNRAIPGIGDPETERSTGTAIAADTRRVLIDALADLGPVSFVADRKSVMTADAGCETVKDDGILVTVGPVIGDEERVEVGVNGFVACLGATWLTYVVEHRLRTGWRVTGTTGTMAIS